MLGQFESVVDPALAVPYVDVPATLGHSNSEFATSIYAVSFYVLIFSHAIDLSTIEGVVTDVYGFIVLELILNSIFDI
jgi:hypothetical protein